MEKFVDVAILGGGITGLSLAAWLSKHSISSIVIEKSSRFGGALETFSPQGYLLERGPNSTLYRRAVQDLVALLGLESAVVTPGERVKERFLALRRAKRLELLPVPHGPISALRSPILSTTGKVRILGDLWAKPSTKTDESVHDFINRHFGTETCSILVDAMLGGIWAADIQTLSARTALPKLWAWGQSHGSIIRGALASRRDPTQPKREPYVLCSFRHGMGQLVDALVSYLRASAHCELRLETQPQLRRGPHGNLQLQIVAPDKTPESVIARRTVICTSNRGASELLAPLAPELAQTIAQIPHAPLGVMHVTVDRSAIAHPLHGFGFLSPRVSRTKLLGAIFSSSLFPHRAPEDQALLTCFVGGARDPQSAEVARSHIQAVVLDELVEALGIKKRPEILRAEHYTHAVPNYPLFHHELQGAIATLETEYPELSISGNWLHGLSVADRITAAQMLSRNISATLQGTRVADAQCVTAVGLS